MKYTAIINERYQVGSHWHNSMSHVRMTKLPNESVADMLIREKVGDSTIFLFHGWPDLVGE